MSTASKFVIGGIFVIAAFVSIVPLFKRDFGDYSQSNGPQKIESIPVQSNAASIVSGRKNEANSTQDIIGTYNGITVKRSDLTTQEKQNLFEAESQVYKAEEGILARKYFDALLEKYAKDNNITDKSIAQQKFITANVNVTTEEVKKFIQQNIDNPQLKGKTLDEQMALVKPYLLQQAGGSFFRDVVAKAKADGFIKVTGSQLPETPRIQINVENAPSIGSLKAPITMVEFADFQCPYCYSAESTVKNILKKYKNKVRFVFKSYPLSQIHPQAINASIAAECALKQNKFWEMHDLLFDNHSKLADNVYPAFAKTIGLDAKQFQSCFQDPSIKEKVVADEAYGQSLGINATPAFYINGILLMGAQPESEFVSIIEKELLNQKN